MEKAPVRTHSALSGLPYCEQNYSCLTISKTCSIADFISLNKGPAGTALAQKEGRAFSEKGTAWTVPALLVNQDTLTVHRDSGNILATIIKGRISKRLGVGGWLADEIFPSQSPFTSSFIMFSIL